MRSIAFFRDSKASKPQYYGPFVSADKAVEFLDDLPEPQSDGLKGTIPLAPFTSHDAAAAAQSILDKRPPELIAADNRGKAAYADAMRLLGAAA